MPSNIAHMLISHKAIYKVKEKNIPEYSAFVDLLDNPMKDEEKGEINLRAYMNLGSLGPDLFYYSKLAKGAVEMFRDGFVNARGVEPWSYHLHSIRPNEFPLKLIEIVFRDALEKNGKYELQAEDYARLAFIAGYLTHIAMDQILHPIINKAVGPYYRSGDFRKKHRECEIFQDYFIYEGVYRLEGKLGTEGEKYDFFKQDFNLWADCIPGNTFQNTEDWFRCFLQRGFAETYNLFPDENTIEDSVDNILLTLRFCNQFGPYKKAANEFRSEGEASIKYKQYIADLDYFKHYNTAVELAALYIMALYEIYALLKANCDFSEKQARRFKHIVSAADLSCPLEKNIFAKAEKALKKTIDLDSGIAFLKDKINLLQFSQKIDGRKKWRKK
jgi:hypothetical protein